MERLILSDLKRLIDWFLFTGRLTTDDLANIQVALQSNPGWVGAEEAPAGGFPISLHLREMVELRLALAGHRVFDGELVEYLSALLEKSRILHLYLSGEIDLVTFRKRHRTAARAGADRESDRLLFDVSMTLGLVSADAEQSFARSETHLRCAALRGLDRIRAYWQTFVD